MAANGLGQSLSTCMSCTKLITDVLLGSLTSSRGWQRLHSRHARLSFTTEHLDGTLDALKASMNRGCQICRLIYSKAREPPSEHSAQFYHIFVRHTRQVRCKFEITTKPLDVYLKHVSAYDPPEALELFAQASTASTLPALAVNLQQADAKARLSQLPHRHPGSASAFDRAKRWLKHCQNDHPECVQQLPRLPTRVVDLRRLKSENKVALYHTRSEEAQYIAFSYCWGQADHLVSRRCCAEHPPPLDDQFPEHNIVVEQLKPKPTPARPKHNKPEFDCLERYSPNNIPVKAFPGTSRDAIYAADALGFEYLWIDSLCIVQNDEEDWVVQGAAMTEIYGNSTLNISATSKATSNVGFLGTLPNLKQAVGTIDVDGDEQGNLHRRACGNSRAWRPFPALRWSSPCPPAHSTTL